MYFLETVAYKLWNHFKQALTNQVLVFPNKRSAVYFSNHLKKIIKEDFIMPRHTTINELFVENSNMVLADHLTLSLQLHDSFKRKTGIAQSFSEFYDFGNTLLADFDVIDKNLVEAKKLFQNIDALKSMDFDFSYLSEQQIRVIKQFWGSFDTKSISKQQESFITLWQKLYDIYEDFNLSLDKEAIAYEGKIFRDLAENPPKGLAESSYIFIGFNALGKAEENIFSHLQKQNKAAFLWDYDKYFTENEENEAGYFIRKYLRKYPPLFEDIAINNCNNATKKIQHINCNGEVQQAKFLGQFLDEKLKNNEKLTDTAIILANEELLLPVLESIPKEISEINVSIGYPFKITAWAHLLSQLILLQKTKVKKDNDFLFSVPIVLEILKNPYCSNINNDGASELINFITEKNLSTVEQSIFKEEFSNIFYPVENIAEFTDKMKDIATQLLPYTSENAIERYVLSESFKKIQYLREILESRGVHDLFFLCEILLKELQQLHIPFTNQSMKGLQLIGFLETRLIDFKEIYILSTNEDFLPSIQQSGSLIPYNLRIGYGLPTLAEQASMYAYYFYRLIGRAEKVTLFSTQHTQGTTIKEPSRYITQLKYESPFIIETFNTQTLLAPIKAKQITIEHQDIIKDVFFEYFSGKRKISPSAINTYIRCPQSFYYKYIAGIKPIQNIAKADDSNTFGSIFHKAAELLYQPYIGKEITTEILAKITSNIKDALTHAFETELFANTKQKLQGKELLIFDILAQYLERLIDYDKQQVPFTILELEKRCQAHITVNIHDIPQQLLLYGFIDRVDKKDGKVRLIDYKTGNTSPIFRSIEELFEVGSKRNNSMVLQTLFYSWLYYKEHAQIGVPSVYAIKEFHNLKATSCLYLSDEKQKKIPLENNIHLLESYETELQKILTTIFNSSSDNFIPNDELCVHDKYTGICSIFLTEN